MINKNCNKMIGALPSSYKVALSYEEQLMLIGEKTEEIIKFINDILEEKISDYIEKQFSNIMIDTIYNAETETLVLFLNREV